MWHEDVNTKELLPLRELQLFMFVHRENNMLNTLLTNTLIFQADTATLSLPEDTRLSHLLLVVTCLLKLLSAEYVLRYLSQFASPTHFPNPS